MGPTTRVVLAVCLLAVVASGTAAGAGASDVSLDPANRTVAGDSVTAFDVVVEDAAGGVGAYNLTVAFPDAAVAEVTAVSVPDGPQLQDETVTDGTATVRVVGMDTAQTGSVRVVTLIVRTVSGNGSGDVELRVAALGDEAGNAYDVAATPDATLTVGQTATPGSGKETTESGSAGGGGVFPAPDTTITTGETTTTTATTTTAATTTTPATTTTAATTTSDSETPRSTTSTSGGTPGFGLGVTLVALTAAALLARRS